MKSHAKNCKSTVIPGLRYRNAMAMIEWLCDTFGFERQAVFAGPGDVVMHAQLTFGNGMIMISSVDNGTEAASLMKQPDEISGAETQAPYLIVSDCDALYAKAKAAGAKMVIDLETKDYGGKPFLVAIQKVTSGILGPMTRGNQPNCRILALLERRIV